MELRFVKIRSQKEQGNFLMCWFIELRFVKIRSQKEQGNFLPKCKESLWAFKFDFREKFFPQSGQGKISTAPVCFSFLCPNLFCHYAIFLQQALEAFLLNKTPHLHHAQRSFGGEELATIRADQPVHVGMYIPVVDLYHGLNNIGITELADHDVRIALNGARFSFSVLLDQVQRLLSQKLF